MAYYDSPKDMFASEDSDSDATVDLSALPGTELRHSADKYEAIVLSDSESLPPFSEKQNEKQRSSRRHSRHTISSSDSEDDSHLRSACPSSKVNKCSLGRRPEGFLGANDVTETISGRDNTATNANKRVLCPEQPAIGLLDDRPLCKYGEKCYRRNPSHFQEFRHPGSV